MKALSIKQPWAWLIVNGFKDIENRDWATTVRGPVLIHAGKAYDKEAEATIVRIIKELDLWEAVGKAGTVNDDYRGGIVGIATIAGCVGRSSSPWFVGEYGFVLKDARPLPFVPLRGQLGFFDVPDEVVAQLNL